MRYSVVLVSGIQQNIGMYSCWKNGSSTPQCFPGGSDDKESACSAGDLGSIPGSGRSPGEGNGSPLQYCCLENPVDRGAWRATVHGVTESDATERLSSARTQCGGAMLKCSCTWSRGHYFCWRIGDLQRYVSFRHTAKSSNVLLVPRQMENSTKQQDQDQMSGRLQNILSLHKMFFLFWATFCYAHNNFLQFLCCSVEIFKRELFLKCWYI